VRQIEQIHVAGIVSDDFGTGSCMPDESEWSNGLTRHTMPRAVRRW
jgi:hypothetical protein